MSKKEKVDLSNSIDSAISAMTYESDRASVIVGAASIEYQLQQMLIKALRPCEAKKDSLFEYYGPLSSFKDKIDMCYRLGLIGDFSYKPLNAIREIRNEFAHSFRPKDKEVIKLCLKLSNHPYTKKRPWLDMYAYSAIGLMSELTQNL